MEDNLIKEEVKNMTYEEIWNRILEYMANYNTIENLIDYNSENISENNSEIVTEPSRPAVVLQTNPDPSPPPSQLILSTPVLLSNTEK
jgi:hypothetical protein